MIFIARFPPRGPVAGLFLPPGPALRTDAGDGAGGFDGVHLGHRRLRRRTVPRARSAEMIAVALTFSPHPIRFFSPGARFYEITTLEEEEDLGSRMGIDVLVFESFAR